MVVKFGLKTIQMAEVLHLHLVSHSAVAV